MCLELGRLSNGYKGTIGTNTVYFMTHEEVRMIPQNRIVMYRRIDVNYRSQKQDPYKVCITVGGNLIQYLYETYTITADLIIAKLLWNSVLFTKCKIFMYWHKNIYLQMPMSCREYMKTKYEIIPPKFIKEYRKSKGWISLSWNTKRNVLSSAGWHPCKQATMKKIRTAWILWNIHSRALETQQ